MFAVSLLILLFLSLLSLKHVSINHTWSCSVSWNAPVFFTTCVFTIFSGFPNNMLSCLFLCFCKESNVLRVHEKKKCNHLTAVSNIRPWLVSEVLKNTYFLLLPPQAVNPQIAIDCLKYKCNCNRHNRLMRSNTYLLKILCSQQSYPHQLHCTSCTNTQSTLIVHLGRFSLSSTFKVQLRMALWSVFQSQRKKCVTESDSKEERSGKQEGVQKSDS